MIADADKKSDRSKRNPSPRSWTRLAATRLRTRLPWPTFLPWSAMGAAAITLSLSGFLLSCSPPQTGTLDYDGDGTFDERDAFPTDPEEQVDSDGDRVGDFRDVFPNNPAESSDIDGDGVGDNEDDDDDGDGIVDSEDADSTDPNVPVMQDDPSDGNTGNGDLGTNDPPLTLPDNPLAGEAGAPIPGLGNTSLAQFEAGRNVFSRTFTAANGLDSNSGVASCAGCHSAPVVGGSGERRPTILVTASGNLETTRNVPALFGVGLLARVPNSVILGLADPLDSDEDGVSGRVNTADGGRVGRFGRKAQVADLESITRGMLENQLGLTSDPLDETTGMLVPGHGRPGVQPFPPARSWERWLAGLFRLGEQRAHAQARPPVDTGDSDDGDNVADPEITVNQLTMLLAFQESLAAPARSPLTAEIAAGEALFESIGCVTCHVSELILDDGTPIYPYTDLLIHDMGRSSSDFLMIGSANAQEYRTTPLWGVSLAESYMHEGGATTLEEAILAHDGEAENSRANFEALSASEQAAVIAFLSSL